MNLTPKFVAACTAVGIDSIGAAGSNPAACPVCLHAEWQSGHYKSDPWLTLSVCRAGCRLTVAESQCLEWWPVVFCSAATATDGPTPPAAWDSLPAHSGNGGEGERPNSPKKLTDRMKFLRAVMSLK